MPGKESQPPVYAVETLSSYVSEWYRAEPKIIEELLYVKSSRAFIVATAPDAVALLTDDDQAPRVANFIERIQYEKSISFDDGDYDEELADALLQNGFEPKLRGLSSWEWQIVEDTASNIADHFEFPFKAAAYYASARGLLDEDKYTLLDTAIAVKVTDELEYDDLVWDAITVDRALTLMSDYWRQTNEIKGMLSLDSYEATWKLLEKAAISRLYEELDLPVVSSILAKLADNGLTLPAWLYFYNDRESILFSDDILPVLFTQDWFAECMEGTFKEIRDNEGDISILGTDIEFERVQPEDLGNTGDALRITERQLDFITYLVRDIHQALEMPDNKRSKWENFARLGALEALYGKRGWQWFRIMYSEMHGRDSLDRLENDGIRALREGQLPPEEYVKLYLDTAAQYSVEHVSGASLFQLMRDGATSIPDPDDHIFKVRVRNFFPDTAPDEE